MSRANYQSAELNDAQKPRRPTETIFRGPTISEPPSTCDPHSTTGRIIGRHINDVRKVWPNTRAVIQNGEHMIVTADYIQNRINVETKNDVVTRIVGFY